VLEAMTEAVARARAGEGPTLIEGKTFRHGGHHVNDPGLYLPKEELERWKAHDPLDVLRQYLREGGMTEDGIAAIDQHVEAVMDEAVEFAEESPQPDVQTFLAEVAAS
jgi:pyruvate dehydrogenase E1 component alpha subunit